MLKCVCVYAACMQVPRGQTRVLDPLELELQVVSHLMWMLATPTPVTDPKDGHSSEAKSFMEI